VPFREESCRSSCIYSGALHSHSRDAVSQHPSTRAGAESIQLIYSGRALQALSDLARQFRCHPIFWRESSECSGESDVWCGMNRKNQYVCTGNLKWGRNVVGLGRLDGRLSGHRMGEQYDVRVGNAEFGAEVSRESERVRESRELKSAESPDLDLTVRAFQDSIFIQQSCLMLPSLLALPCLLALASLLALTSLLAPLASLLQGLHSLTLRNTYEW